MARRKLIGQYLLETRTIMPEQLETCLQRQAALVDRGLQQTIGQLLVQEGYATQDLVDQALHQQQLDRTGAAGWAPTKNVEPLPSVASDLEEQAPRSGRDLAESPAPVQPVIRGR